MFCPKCGSILMPKTVKGKKVMGCSCGYNSGSAGEIKIRESVGRVSKGNVDVVDTEKEDNVLPITEAECPKCGNSQAHFWEVQTRAGDEPATKFFKCTKCKHTWRDYS